MQIAPIPAYLGIDALAEAVSAGKILERLGKHHDADKEYMKHLKDFLMASMVIHNKKEPKTELEQNTFFNCLGDTHLRVWSQKHFETLIEPPAAPVLAPPQGAPLPPAPVHAPLQAPAQAPGTKDSKQKWSNRKVKYFVLLCGKEPADSRQANLDQLPGWFQDIAEETDTFQQLSIIRELLKDNKKYSLDTANNPDLLDYIIKMQFGGKDSADYPSVRNACKQLSPYLCSNLTDTQLADRMDVKEAIANATYITVHDSEKLFSKSTPITPALYQDFVDMLKKFANTLFALFGVNCPLYKDLKKLVTAVEAIKQGARDKVFNHNSKALILWLTHLQARTFFADPEDSVDAFDDMVKQLKRKTNLSDYMEMPPELLEKEKALQHGGKSETDPKRQGDTPPASPTKQAKKTSSSRNPKLKVIDAAIAKAIETTKLTYVAPSFICKKLNTSMNDLIGNPENCGNYMLLGKCGQQNCTKKHVDASPDEVSSILSTLKPFLDEPKLVAEKKRTAETSFYNNTSKKYKAAVQAPKSTAPTLIPPDNNTTSPSKVDFSFIEKCTTTKEEIASEIKRVVHDEAAIPTDIKNIKADIGKTNIALMRPSGPALEHPASEMLLNYADNGCPVDCGKNWTREHIEAALLRGPHKSATSDEAIQVLRGETTAKVEAGFARVVKYGDIKDLLPPSFKISPIAGVPHKSRKFRWILDLSFQLLWNGKKLPSVNSATTVQSKHQSMTQLGQVLKRIIAIMADMRKKDEDSVFRFAKLDIKDGFWRLGVSDEDAWNFCYVLPSLTAVDNIDDIEIVVPNSLQMGWCESPPLFCSASETGRDVIEVLLQQADLPSHKFENQMFDDSYEDTITPQEVVNLIEVFVDDYIAVSNAATQQQLLHISRAMLHGIHSIFPPPEVTGHAGEDPIAQKKMVEGEGLWQDCKEILGWMFDGKAYTISLPEKKIAAIIAEINKMKKISKHKQKRKRRVPLNRWQKLAGKLMHASFGLVGGKAMFSPIWKAMEGSPKLIPFNPALVECLLDWKYILKNMLKSPTDISLLVAEYPHYTAYLDACGLGAGGVLLPGSSNFPPLVWQIEWPKEIKERFARHEITINDLELAAIVISWLAFENILTDMSGVRIGLSCDNTSAVSWNQKGSSSSSKVAGRLLRMLYIRLRDRGAGEAMATNIAGINNLMADVASRAFKEGKFFAANDNLINYFNTHFPLQQNESWQQFHLPTEWTSRVMSCLLGEQQQMESLRKLKTTIIIIILND